MGFSFYTSKDGIRIRIHRLNQIVTGWVNYFGLADARSRMKSLDEWIRRRLRACIWKQWKKIKTKHDNLVRLGIEDYKAWEFANTRKGYWRISNSPILNATLTNRYFESIGYKSLSQRYQTVHNS